MKKICSYDKLMMNFSQGPCSSPEDVSNEKYYCEYADAACYVTVTSGVGSIVSCNPDKKGFNYEVVRNHAKLGMCVRL